MRGLSEILYRSALTAWIGGMWVVGYGVAPTLFASLGDRQLAGLVAGRLFSLVGWIGLAAAGYLLVFLAARWRGGTFRRSVFWLVLGLAGLVAAGQFGLQPLLAQLKADALPRDVMESVLRDRFVAWHGVSSVLYLIQSGVGLWLVAWADRGLR